MSETPKAFLSMLKNHPDAVNDSNIPSFSEWWFLTKSNNRYRITAIDLNIRKPTISIWSM